MRCVVGGCTQPYEDVKRCYWSRDVGLSRQNVTDHAYLDLCWFHIEFMKPHRISNYVEGWSPLEACEFCGDNHDCAICDPEFYGPLEEEQ